MAAERKQTKIGIIGPGNVGAHVLYRLALQGLAELPLTLEETLRFHECCEDIRRSIEALKQFAER